MVGKIDLILLVKWLLFQIQYRYKLFPFIVRHENMILFYIHRFYAMYICFCLQYVEPALSLSHFPLYKYSFFISFFHCYSPRIHFKFKVLRNIRVYSCILYSLSQFPVDLQFMCIFYMPIKCNYFYFSKKVLWNLDWNGPRLCCFKVSQIGFLGIIIILHSIHCNRVFNTTMTIT